MERALTDSEKKNIRLIAFDLDGTLLGRQSEVSEYTRGVLARAFDKGIVCAAATGRALAALPDDVSGHPGIKYAICSNGSMIYDLADGSLIRKRCFKSEELLPFVDYIFGNDHMHEAATGGVPYIEASALDRLDYYGIDTSLRQLYIKRTRKVVSDFRRFVQDNADSIENICISFHDNDDKLRFAAQLAEISNLSIVSSQHSNVEIEAPETSKATALLWLAKRLGISRKSIIAFGDSFNDKAMLDAAGIAVVMDNARDEMKVCADIIAPPNYEDGVAKVIEALL